MAVSVASVVLQIQGHYPEISQSLALTLLNDAHNEILSKIRLVQDTQVVVGTVAGTGEYAIADAIYHIWDVTIGSTNLSATTIGDLDSQSRGWRTGPQAQPVSYYIDAGYIGFNPIPDAIYAVTLTTSSATAVLGEGDSLPSPAREGTAWIYRVLYKFALMEHSSDAQLFQEAYEEALKDLATYVSYRTPRVNDVSSQGSAFNTKR